MHIYMHTPTFLTSTPGDPSLPASPGSPAAPGGPYKYIHVQGNRHLGREVGIVIMWVMGIERCRDRWVGTG